ncbi:aliphatic sulfonate ABC transporter substrate-binding protein [Bacillaceae bacterium S4-13-58]
MRRFLGLISLFVIVGGLLAACGTSKESTGSGSEGKEVVVGYFPNINHVPAMVAKDQGYYEEELGDGVTVKYMTFADGADFMNALKTDNIDIGLVGPGPAMNHFDSGTDVKMIAGGSTGGTVVLARKDSGIGSIEDFDGKIFVTPRVGCTHDVQIETFLKEQGITSQRIGGTMKHQTGKPAQYEAFFDTGKVDIAVAPEPWASVLQINTGAKVIIDHDEISFGKTLPASVLVTSAKFIEENADLVQAVVNAHEKANNFIESNPEEAKAITLKDIEDITGQSLEKEVIDLAWERIGFSLDLNQEDIQKFADSSYDLKFMKNAIDLTEIFDTQFIE